MNGAIELPGEANPLNAHNLYQVLTSAASANQQQVKTGTQQLQNWEKQHGYHSSLQSISIDLSLPVEVRYLSVIQLKNGIDKYWRKSAVNSIKKDEKLLIRSRCLDAGLDEPDSRLVLQNALVIAKIVRFEYPLDWPEAMTLIIECLRESTHTPKAPSHLRRILLILLETTKELGSGRLLRSRANLQKVAPEILQVLGGIYVHNVNAWRMFLRNGGDERAALDSIEQSLLALRVLRRLVMVYDHPHRHSEMIGLWNIVGTHLDDMLSLIIHDSTSLNPTVQRLIEKHLVQFAKLHLNMAQAHPVGFACLPNSTSLARAYWSLIQQFGESIGLQIFDSEEEETPVMEKICLKGLLLLRACVKMVFNPAQILKYQQPEDREEKKRAMESVRNDLLTDSFAREVMETLVTRYFIIRPKDLRDWQEEPDEWERREEGEGDVWEYSIRSCSEKLYLDLVIHYKESLVPPLLGVIHNAANLQNTDTVLKDSIYCAVGLAAPVLEDKLDFGTLLKTTLAPEVQISKRGYHILRRRIAIVLGQWLPVKEGLDRALVYQIFQHLLDPNDNDKVIRITAGRNLKNVVDPFDFAVEEFKPFAGTIITRMIALIQEAELTETKMALLNTLSVIVIRMETMILDFADMIMESLPRLWDAAGEEYLFKQSIFAIIAALMTSLKASSTKYHPMMLPLIRTSVEPESPTRVYLLEDALDLWSKILDQSSTPSPELTSLAVYLFPMYTVASDTLRVALEITESYITLIPHEILSSAPDLLSAFQPLLGTLKPRDTYYVTTLIELLIRVSLLTNGLSSLENLTSALLSSNTLYTMLSALQAAHEAHQTTGPNSIPFPLDSLVETDYLCILAGLAAASPQLFISAITATAPSLGEHFPTTIKWLLEEWFAHIDNIGHPDRKKLSMLALTSLFSTAEPWILSHLQQLMSIWTETIMELIDEETGSDTMVFWNVEDGKREGESAKEERMRRVGFEDVVRRVDVKAAVREAVQGVVERVGRERFEGWVGDVDRDVVAGFGALGVV